MPTWLRRGAARNRGHDWPKASAGGGMVLTAVSTAPDWWVRDEDPVAVGRQTALRRMTTQAGWWIMTMSAIQPERAMCTIL